jgi:hypothetical protein
MAGGPKGKYETHVKPKLLLIEAWARDGLIIEQIAKNLDIAPSTFYDYQNKHEELSEALKRGKEVVDIEVENALLKRAMGYRYDEVTCEGGFETKRVTKEVQPDVTAQIFWLKNRRPETWRDKKDIDTNINGELKMKTDLRNLTAKELEQLEGIITKATDAPDS